MLRCLYMLVLHCFTFLFATCIMSRLLHSCACTRCVVQQCTLHCALQHYNSGYHVVCARGFVINFQNPTHPLPIRDILKIYSFSVRTFHVVSMYSILSWMHVTPFIMTLYPRIYLTKQT